MVPELAGDGRRRDSPTCAGRVRRPSPPRCRRAGWPSASDRRRASVGPEAAGTFAGYGVDVPGRGCRPAPPGVDPAELPLCALITGWLRGCARPAGARRGAGVRATGTPAQAALAFGQAAARRARRAPTSRRGARRRRRRQHPDPARPRAATTRIRSRCRPRSTTRSPRVTVAALARLPDVDRRPRRLPGARRAGRSRRRDRPRSSTAARPTASATSRASGTHDRPIAIVGPTGTGKSAAGAGGRRALLGGEIVNADAMQLYRGMDIGTAKLPVAERRGIPHHQLDVLDVTETATVARYQRGRRRRRRGDHGARRGARSSSADRCCTSSRCSTTGRSRPPTRRCGPGGSSGSPRSGSRRCTASWPRVDAAAAASILPTDGRRIVRALEVVELTGQPFAASAPTIGAPRWDTAIIGLDWDTAVLDERLAPPDRHDVRRRPGRRGASRCWTGACATV